jgi:hypothetical protein
VGAHVAQRDRVFEERVVGVVVVVPAVAPERRQGDAVVLGPASRQSVLRKVRSRTSTSKPAASRCEERMPRAYGVTPRLDEIGIDQGDETL